MEGRIRGEGDITGILEEVDGNSVWKEKGVLKRETLVLMVLAGVSNCNLEIAMAVLQILDFYAGYTVLGSQRPAYEKPSQLIIWASLQETQPWPIIGAGQPKPIFDHH